jgi:hypothetical protein
LPRANRRSARSFDPLTLVVAAGEFPSARGLDSLALIVAAPPGGQ